MASIEHGFQRAVSSRCSYLKITFSDKSICRSLYMRTWDKSIWSINPNRETDHRQGWSPLPHFCLHPITPPTLCFIPPFLPSRCLRLTYCAPTTLAFQSLKDMICYEKGCRPIHIQTPSVPRRNGICMGDECRLLNHYFTTLRTFNLELLSIKYRETLTKTGWKVINASHWKITNQKVLTIPPHPSTRKMYFYSVKF